MPAMSEQTEADLLAAAKAGSPEALRALIARHAVRVLRLCLEVAGDAADAEDARQEAMLALQRSIARLSADRPLAVWLARVATNACFKIMRSRRRLEERHRAAAPPPAETGDPLTRAEDLGRIAEALKRLPGEHARILRWKFHEEVDTEAIARRLGVAVGSARVCLHRALAELRARVRGAAQ